MAESTFQKALISWRDIDLGSLQKRLKTQCREVKQGEESSLLERKSLAQAAKGTYHGYDRGKGRRLI